MINSRPYPSAPQTGSICPRLPLSGGKTRRDGTEQTSTFCSFGDRMSSLNVSLDRGRDSAHERGEAKPSGQTDDFCGSILPSLICCTMRSARFSRTAPTAAFSQRRRPLIEVNNNIIAGAVNISTPLWLLMFLPLLHLPALMPLPPPSS